MSTTHVPMFCLTSDIDWASEYCIRDFLELLGKYGVKATIFATHRSAVLDEFQASGAIDVGIHPNFRPNSTHGRDTMSVIDHMFQEFPNAKSFRSHAFVDSSDITTEMVRRGITYDSNLCLYLQPNLTALRHASGLVRFPVFFEDDSHWINSPGEWDFEKYHQEFFSPGLKICNFHPGFVAANIPSQEYYLKIRNQITTMTSENIEEFRFKGKGARTFLIELLEGLATRGERVQTLSELNSTFPKSSFTIKKDETAGRANYSTSADHDNYWRLTNDDKQKFLKQAYEERNANDIYATSRDFHARELEITSIKRNLKDKGKLLDLGSGNGYTALSLAKEFSHLEITAVDFSENLVSGAKELSQQMQAELKRQPVFLCADAIAYIAKCADNSVDYVLTERFLLNMPSKSVQHEIIREIYRVLAPGGRLLMCEMSDKGFEGLNDLREAVGLSRIPATSADNITSIRFDDKEVENFAQELGFKVRQKLGYSSYFMITRVLHPLLVRPQSPRFDAPINELARTIQHHAPLLPGYGGNTLWVLEK